MFTARTLKPGLSEEDCSITTLYENKRLSIFFCTPTNNIHKYEGCFLGGQVSSNGLKVFNGFIVDI